MLDYTLNAPLHSYVNILHKSKNKYKNGNMTECRTSPSTLGSILSKVEGLFQWTIDSDLELWPWIGSLFELFIYIWHLYKRYIIYMIYIFVYMRACFTYELSNSCIHFITLIRFLVSLFGTCWWSRHLYF